MTEKEQLFRQRLAEFIGSAHRLLEAWDEDSCKGYPAEMPSFDDFVHSLYEWNGEMNSET